MTGTLLAALLPIVVLIALGVLAGLVGRLDNRNVGSLNTLVMDFALPAALLSAILRTTRPELVQQWGLLLVLSVGMLGLWLLVYALQRLAFGQSSGAAAVMAISVALPNFAAAGVPLLSVVDGGHGRLQAALAIMVGAVVLSPLTLFLLDLDRTRRETGTAGGGRAAKAAIGRVARAPLVLAPLLAVALVLVHVRLPALLLRPFGLLGKASSATALLLTGLVLSANRVSLSAQIVLAVLLVNLMHPLVGWGLVGLLPMSRIDGVGAILLSALPSGFFGIFFALRYGVATREAASVVAISTAVGIASLGIILVLLGATPVGVAP